MGRILQTTAFESARVHDFSMPSPKLKRATLDPEPLAVKFAQLAIVTSLRMRHQSRTKNRVTETERRIHEYEMNRLEDLYFDLMADYHRFRNPLFRETPVASLVSLRKLHTV